MNKQHVQNTQNYQNKSFSLSQAADMSRFNYMTDPTNYDHSIPGGFAVNRLKSAANLAPKSDNFNDLYAPGLPSAAKLGIRTNNSPVTNIARNTAQRVNNVFGDVTGRIPMRVQSNIGIFAKSGVNSILDQNARQLGTNTRNLLIGHDAPFLQNMGLDENILRSAGFDATADARTRMLHEQLERDMAKQMRFRFHKWGGY